jgi:hypothetical protein
MPAQPCAALDGLTDRLATTGYEKPSSPFGIGREMKATDNLRDRVCSNIRACL